MGSKVRTITITDVAEKAGVSKSTVSQYLNKRYEYMGEETKERIAKSINELGYKPNLIGRSLKQKTSTTIGVIVANISHEFSTQIVKSIEDYCNASDFHIIVCNAEDDPKKEKKYIDMLRAKQIEGIIVFPTSTNINLYKELTEEDYPLVFIDRDVPEVDVSSIMLDNKKAAALAVEEFITKGYSNLGIVTNTTTNNVTPRIERVNGFIEALSVNGLEVNGDYIKSVGVDKINSELEKMMRLKMPPEAILAGNDLVLAEILKFVKHHQLKIPEDLAVIGIDDVSYASIYNPELTTVAQPTSDMGKEAAELLLNRIKGNHMERTNYYYEPTLMKRSSC
ncbi:LacI family DNA-binding transcriptional regulator [Lentibacillus sp. CBA3610]|uniref:LacI family DNA-binding transcriptional regulator n=1 Tax=Lentibacillus sp. CBA3610 TaxID=2518176 RepID=UPI001595871F|nr:substrate-binding domain-containing protein [Lentibacillus sp. CBA3610]QKY70249.1 LacI family transcriptional regulator [Lentibacillus sp. CBA3610]